MLREYQISNFKAFAGPEIVPIRPITLIYGPNSSGKSSILQSLLMLKQTLDDSENPRTTLMARGNLVDLGSYQELVHRHNVDRSFSFKMVMETPRFLDDPFGYHPILGDYGGGFSDLEESLRDFQTVGLRVCFSHAMGKPLTTVSEIELYLGDNFLPVIAYNLQPLSPNKEDSSWTLRLKALNDQHEYWRRHWETFDEADESYARGVIEDVTLDPVERMQRQMDKMSKEDLNSLIEELKKRHDQLSKEALEQIDADIKSVPQDTLELPPEEKERLLKLKGFKLALEAYRIRSLADEVELRHFLPERLNGYEMSHFVAYGTEEEKRNLSLLALTAARLIRRVLAQALYIGPLRNYPERYFMFSGVSAAYVGRSGKFVPEILVGDQELLAKVNEQFDRFNLGYELKLSSLSDQSSDIQDLFALRLYDKSTGIHVGMTDVGFGLSQVLPVIVQCLLSKQNMILIEQPELHLHPRLQAELGDLFIDSALGESRNHLLIETHSEHVLLRIMRRIRETTAGRLPAGSRPVRPENVMVLFIKPEGRGSVIHEMPLNDKGELTKPWPGGFFEEDFEELFEGF